MGDMRIDQQSGRDMLCIAGGTGLAPVKAMIDGMARWNTARNVTLFFGARRAGDLYDMGALHRLAAVNPGSPSCPSCPTTPRSTVSRGCCRTPSRAAGSWGNHDVVRVRLAGHDPGHRGAAD